VAWAQPHARKVDDEVTSDQALRFIKKHGVVLESARDHAVPNLADEVLGKVRRGSWWGHPRGKKFFAVTRQIRSHPNVLVCRLVGGKITYVHRRLWPALARRASEFASVRLDAIREVHTDAGAHRVQLTPFRKWIGPDVRAKASELTLANARAQLQRAALMVMMFIVMTGCIRAVGRIGFAGGSFS
jgi:hypothetical protein